MKEYERILQSPLGGQLTPALAEQLEGISEPTELIQARNLARAIDGIPQPNPEQRIQLFACYVEVYGITLPDEVKTRLGITKAVVEDSIFAAADSSEMQDWFSDIESTLNPLSKRRDELISELRNESIRPLTYGEISKFVSEALGVFTSIDEVKDALSRLGNGGKIIKIRDIMRLRDNEVKELWGLRKRRKLPLQRIDIARILTAKLGYDISIWQVDISLERLRNQGEIPRLSAIEQNTADLLEAVLPFLQQENPRLSEVEIAEKISAKLGRPISVKQIRNAAMVYIAEGRIERRSRSKEQSEELREAIILLRSQGITSLERLRSAVSRNTGQSVTTSALTWFINQLLREGKISSLTTTHDEAEAFYALVKQIVLENPFSSYRELNETLSERLDEDIPFYKFKFAVTKLQKRKELPYRR